MNDHNTYTERQHGTCHLRLDLSLKPCRDVPPNPDQQALTDSLRLDSHLTLSTIA